MSESSTDDDALAGAAGEGKTETVALVENVEGAEGVKDSSGGAPPLEKEDDNKPKTLEAAVRAALDKGKEQSSGSGEGEDAKPKADAEAAAKAKEVEAGAVEELTDEEKKALSTKAQLRFKQLISQSKDLSAQIERDKPAVEGWKAVVDFSNRAGLTREDVNTGFNIMDLMKNNPGEAFKQLTPIYNSLRALVGDVLPEDLQQQVNTGQLTEAHAQELSKLRAEKGHTQNRTEVEQARNAERQKTDLAAQSQKLQDDVSSEVVKWENRWKASDPDFAVKHGRVSEAIELELLRLKEKGALENSPGKYLPKSVTESVKLMDDIRKKMEPEFKKFIPQRKAITPVTGAGATNGSKPAPKSHLEAVQQALGH